MHLRIRTLMFAGLAALFLNTTANADYLMVIESSSGAFVEIFDDSPLDTNNFDQGVITVDTAQLNLLLTDFRFSDLGAFSNRDMPDDFAILRQTGSVERRTNQGDAWIEISVYASNYLFPVANPLTMESSASATFTNTDNTTLRTFQSFYEANGTEVAGDLLVQDPPTGIGPFSLQTDTVSTLIPDPIFPYTLVNVTRITMGPVGTGLGTQVQFTGATVAVPEPSTLALLGLGLPFLAARALRRRRLSAAA